MRIWVMVVVAVLGMGQMKAEDPARVSKGPTSMPATRPATNVVVATSLKGVVMGLAIYAAANNDTLPPDLGTLITSGTMKQMNAKWTPEQTLRLFAPNIEIPETIIKGTPEEQAAWVNQNSTFVFLGGGGSFVRVPAASVHPVAFERLDLDPNKKQIAVGFYDGHIETQARAQVEVFAPKKE